MIAIRYHSPGKLLPWLRAAGITPDSVLFNPPTLKNVTVLVDVGGYSAKALHCYVQTFNGILYIECLDPSDAVKPIIGFSDTGDKELKNGYKPTNAVFLILALEKAKSVYSSKNYRTDIEIETAKTPAKIQEWASVIPSDSHIAFDIETNPRTCEMTCIAFSYRVGDIYKALVVPLSREGNSIWPLKSEMLIWKAIATVLATPNPKVAQNYIFDTMVLSRLGVAVKGDLYDTMLIGHLIQPELPKGLHDLGRMYLCCDVWKDIKGYASNEDLWRYCARDAAYTLAIFDKQIRGLEEAKDSRLNLLYNQIVPLSRQALITCERGWKPNISAIAEMEAILQPEIDDILKGLSGISEGMIPDKVTYKYRRGAIKPNAIYCRGVDEPKLVAYKRNSKGEKVVKEVRYEKYEEISLPEGVKKGTDCPFYLFEKQIEKREFNPNAPDRVKDVILGLGHKIPTRNHKEMTDKFAIRKLRDSTKHPFYAKLLEYRDRSKLLSTYCNVRIDEDGYIRFSYNLAGTVGGRLSSKGTAWGTGLNSQNIPKRFRHISVPFTEDKVIVNVDFAQADPHMVAWLSGDSEMEDVLRNGDLHAHTGSKIFGYDITNVPGYSKDTSKERKLGKICNNALNYGMGWKTFQRNAYMKGLELDDEECKETVKKYHEAYPGVRAWQERVQQEIMKSRCLVTPFGRVRRFYGYMGDSYSLSKLYNEAYSYIPQTTVGDALNAAWLNLTNLANAANLDIQVLQQCHDSLKLQCNKDDLKIVAKTIKEAFKSVTFEIHGVTRNFPIDIEWGYNWRDMEGSL